MATGPGSRAADRGELEVMAGALLAYHLRGRQTDDTLLAELEATWVACEAIRREQQDRLPLHVGRGRQAVRAELSRQERVELGRQLGRQQQAAMDRYLAGWRRWLDQHTEQDTPPDRGD